MFQKIKQTFVARASGSTFHGLTNLVNSEYIFLKLVWFLAMLASFSYFLIVIMQTVSEYYEYPVITNINRVYEKEPQFPMVEFCNSEAYYCHFNTKACQDMSQISNCLMFNSGKNGSGHQVSIKKSEKPGKKGGLYLVMTSDPNNIHLFIHNQSVGFNEDKAIEISVGMETSLVIRKVYESKLSYPYSDCKKGYTFELGSEDILNKTSYAYFQSECFYLCPMQKMFEAINKTEEYFRNFQYYFTNYNKWYLSTGVNYKSYRSLYPEIYAHVEDKYITLGRNEFCGDICPIGCELISYTISSYYKLNNQPFAEVYIYYDEFTHTEITEIPKITSSDLFSMIGTSFILKIVLI